MPGGGEQGCCVCCRWRYSVVTLRAPVVSLPWLPASYGPENAPEAGAAPREGSSRRGLRSCAQVQVTALGSRKRPRPGQVPRPSRGTCGIPGKTLAPSAGVRSRFASETGAGARNQGLSRPWMEPRSDRGGLLLVLASRNAQVTRAKARGRLKAGTVNRHESTSTWLSDEPTSPERERPRLPGPANWYLMTSQILIEHLVVRVLCDCTIGRGRQKGGASSVHFPNV
ncbi:hypothetical protein MAPG_05376 [Magnaporthiopsis poae ATCC 64411]|uniref:Uncharacterized protein n=1 Tax=Magnaporthiopsis poae (strain ATCC 64411 / 73-15) TaxID=644358 RepID=A0A0C4DZ84_MAGP6|nr:hypothetical protein MAPG_05376 [Magnaporthiopsis poae ATCC 64411]